METKPTTKSAANTARLYYYRPIGGGVFKCAGFGAENAEHRAFYVPYFTTTETGRDSFKAGAPIICEYRGGRINAEGKPISG